MRPGPQISPSSTVGHGVHIRGVGCYLPEERITNAQLESMVNTSDEWIFARTGIRERCKATAVEATSDLALRAAANALDDAQLEASALDFVILATVTPDTPVPAASCLVQTQLGAVKAAAFDINAGCSGFLYSLHLAAGMIRGGAAENIMIVGAEVLTRVTDYTDRRSCILFGDGAGAFVVSREGRYRVLYSSVGSDGSMADLITIPGGGSRSPVSAKTIDEKSHFLRLDGARVFREAVRKMADSAVVGLRETGLSVDDVTWIIPHQANERISSAVADRLGVPMSRMISNIAGTGNTSSASIPIAMASARDQGLIHDGQLLMLLAFGAGTTWACQIIRVEEEPPMTGENGNG